MAGQYTQMHTDRCNSALPVLPGGWMPASSHQHAAQSPHCSREPQQLTPPPSACAYPRFLARLIRKPQSVSRRRTRSALPNPKPSKVRGLFSAGLSQAGPPELPPRELGPCGKRVVALGPPSTDPRAASANCAAPVHPPIGRTQALTCFPGSAGDVETQGFSPSAHFCCHLPVQPSQGNAKCNRRACGGRGRWLLPVPC